VDSVSYFISRCPAYAVPDRSHFFSVHLAAEAAAAATKLTTYLLGFIHLTLSFDGWSSKGHDEIYTVHITTPLRRSFLIDGLILTGLSTAGQILFEFLSRVCFLFFSFFCVTRY
jgi:hypothetical protein